MPYNSGLAMVLYIPAEVGIVHTMFGCGLIGKCLAASPSSAPLPPGKFARPLVVSLAPGVSPSGWRRGYEETDGRTLRPPPSNKTSGIGYV